MSWPRLPGHTCPMIDKVKAGIESAQAAADVSGEDLEDWVAATQEVIRSLRDLDAVMEDIRSANSSLREAAEDARAEADRREQEVSTLQDRISDLESELSDACSRIE